MKYLIIYLFETVRKEENAADNIRKIYLTNYQRIKTVINRGGKSTAGYFLHKAQKENNSLIHIKRLAGENSRNAF